MEITREFIEILRESIAITREFIEITREFMVWQTPNINSHCQPHPALEEREFNQNHENTLKGYHERIYGNHKESSSQCQHRWPHPRCTCRGIINGNHKRIHHIHKRIYGKTPNVNNPMCPCRGIINGNPEKIHRIHKRIHGKTPNVNSHCRPHPRCPCRGRIYGGNRSWSLLSWSSLSANSWDDHWPRNWKQDIMPDCCLFACRHIYIFLLPWHSTGIDHSKICYLTNMICPTDTITVIVTR